MTLSTRYLQAASRPLTPDPDPPSPLPPPPQKNKYRVSFLRSSVSPLGAFQAGDVAEVEITEERFQGMLSVGLICLCDSASLPSH